MNRQCGYQLLAAISHMKETEKDMPDGLGEKLDALEGDLHSAMSGKSEGSDESASDAMDKAKDKTRERFKKSSDGQSDEKPADDKSDEQYKS